MNARAKKGTGTRTGAKKKPAAHTHHHDEHPDESVAVLDGLRIAGYRITAPRKSIVEALATAASPKTAKEIGVRTKIKDASTVYRTLAELVKAGFALEFTEKGSAYYELSHQHHDHAICSSCGVMEHIPCEATKSPRSLAKAGWKIESHEALYRGVCGACSAA